jgi:hypothetical protein
MDKVVSALGPAFAAGLALQRLLELLDPILDRLVPADYKKLVLGLVSLVVGLLLAFGAGLRVLLPLGFTGPDSFDAFVSGLIISAGTEGFNSIMKFLGYAKESKKAEAAAKATAVPGEALAAVQRRAG